MLLDASGRPHLGDFGVAVRLESLRSNPGRPQGTPYYMAPEVVQLSLPRSEQPGHSLRPDHRSDVYSLGVILYELLTAQLPYKAVNTEELFDLILHNDPPPPRLVNGALPPALEDVCLKALARNPAERYRTAGDLRAALLAALPPSAAVAPPPANKRKLQAILAGVAAVAVIGIAIALATSGGKEPTQPRDKLPVLDPKNAEARLTAIKSFLKDREPPPPLRPRARPKNADAVKDAPLTPALALTMGRANKAREAGHTKEEWEILHDVSNKLIDGGYFATAKGVGERMVEIAEPGSSNEPFAHLSLGLALYRAGEAEEGLAHYETALKFFRRIYDKAKNVLKKDQVSGIVRLVGLTLTRIGNANKALERYDNAEAAYLEAKKLLEPFDDRKSELSTLLLNLGSLQSTRGRHGDAEATLQEAVKLARELGKPDDEAEALINLGNAQSRGGDNEGAIKTYAKADRLMPATASYDARSLLLFNWLESLLEADRIADAKPLYQRLRRMVRPNDARALKLLDTLGPALSD